MRAGAMTMSRGHTPRKALPTERDAEQELIRTDRGASYPAPDGKLTFDKLSSVFLSGNQTRDDAPSHIRVARRVPREVGELWVNMCPAHVYELGREDAGRSRSPSLPPTVFSAARSPPRAAACSRPRAAPAEYALT